MAVSIRERILEHWETTIKSVTVANGYSRDIPLVERFRLLDMDQAPNLVVQIKRGDDVRVDGPIGLDSRVVTIRTSIKIRPEPKDEGLPTETIVDAIEQDLYHALMLDPTRGGLAVDTVFVRSGEIETDEQIAQGQTALEFEVHYRHLRGDMTSG